MPHLSLGGVIHCFAAINNTRHTVWFCHEWLFFFFGCCSSFNPRQVCPVYFGTPPPPPPPHDPVHGPCLLTLCHPSSPPRQHTSSYFQLPITRTHTPKHVPYCRAFAHGPAPFALVQRGCDRQECRGCALWEV